MVEIVIAEHEESNLVARDEIDSLSLDGQCDQTAAAVCSATNASIVARVDGTASRR